MRLRIATRAARLILTGGAAFGLMGGLIPVAAQAQGTIRISTGPRQRTYPETLDIAISAMEEGKHIQALAPLRDALGRDRNTPEGVLALGTLYLQAGSYTRAAREFDRAAALAPDDPLARWGQALAALALGKRDPAAFDAFAAGDIPAAPTVAAYVRLLSGEAGAVRDATRDITPTDPDPLRLEVAGFAALRGGKGGDDARRGEALLTALLARPDMKALTEDRALLFPFEVARPATGGATPLPEAIGFPEPAGGFPFTGRVTLSPSGTLPTGAAYVTFSTEGGGGFLAAVNAAPWVSEWNTANYPNGLYTLRTTVLDSDRHILSETSRTVTLANAGAPPSRALTETERKDLRGRLLALLTPRPSRKAAHWALSQLADARGDADAAVAHREAVLAIDPAFGNAFALVKQHNRETRGAQASYSYWKGITTDKIVAITFDDGPNPLPARTPALLNALKKNDVRATFFVIGARAEQNLDLLKRMDDEGHEVENHSYSHPNLTYLDAAGVERELGRTSVIIREATGKRPQFYRPPGGNFNKSVAGCAEALGMAGAYWTIDGLKFERDPFTAAQLAKFVLTQVRPGAIILLHNAPQNTIDALPLLAAGLRAKGYEMVTMSELARRASPGGTSARELKSYTGGD